MTADALPRKKCPPPGAPAWVMTFADLMSLLMCFFVLLLSFSEMDVLKFKQIAGSMQFAFGVQREVPVKDIPKGVNVIATEFSPGRPDPSPISEVRQHTTEDLAPYLDISDETPTDPKGDGENDARSETEADAEEIRHAFEDEIEEGLIDVETDQQRIIIRIQEKGAFPSGSADLVRPFEPVVDKMSDVLARTRGRIVIAGHTDNIPISTARFRSNWELSAARSVTVLHQLMRSNAFPAERFLIEGHADSNPLVPNDNPANRARNRRVELIIVKGDDVEAEDFGTVVEPARTAPAGEGAGPAAVPAPSAQD